MEDSIKFDYYKSFEHKISKGKYMHFLLQLAAIAVDYLNKVFKLQKRAARVILDADTRANSVDLFGELNWLLFS